MTTISTKLTKDQLQAAALRGPVVLTPDEFHTLTLHIFETGMQVTAYPSLSGITNPQRFLQSLVEQGLAKEHR